MSDCVVVKSSTDSVLLPYLCGGCVIELTPLKQLIEQWEIITLTAPASSTKCVSIHDAVKLYANNQQARVLTVEYIVSEKVQHVLLTWTIDMYR